MIQQLSWPENVRRLGVLFTCLTVGDVAAVVKQVMINCAPDLLVISEYFRILSENIAI